ncbi:MAG: hydrogenase maturation nickel metallochaperone HypA [Henriciella sp.]|nr:hydrogenase maturation nickel metallochaperone HypA [Henriciella sp.]
MHEAGMINALIRKILDIAAAENSTDVQRVSVWLGAFSHMSPSHFKDHYDQASAGTIAAGAELDITCSDDTAHADAHHIVLKSVEVAS